MSEQYTVLYLIFSDAKIGLWSFLQLTDILHLSISVAQTIINTVNVF